MKAFLLLLWALVAIEKDYAQDTSILKRTPYKLIVAVDKKNYYEEELKAAAYVLPDKTIQLYPGEKLYAEVELEDGVVKSITAVKEIKDPSKTLTISFTQNTNDKVHEMIMLKIDNPFTKTLHYTAGIFLFKQKKWVGTDVYPVRPGISGIETWPDIITSIALSDWKFTSQ
jgi:hypothetical protein